MCSTQCTFPGKIITGGKTGRRFTSQRFQAKKSQFGKRDRTAKSVSDRRSAKKRKQTKGERIKKAERTSKNALFPPSADDYGIKRGSKIRLLSVREKESKKNNMIPIVPPQKSFFSFSAAGEKSFRIATMSFFPSFLVLSVFRLWSLALVYIVCRSPFLFRGRKAKLLDFPTVSDRNNRPPIIYRG